MDHARLSDVPQCQPTPADALARARAGPAPNGDGLSGAGLRRLSQAPPPAKPRLLPPSGTTRTGTSNPFSVISRASADRRPREIDAAVVSSATISSGSATATSRAAR